MIERDKVSAQKYATAFLNVFGDQISRDDYYVIDAAVGPIRDKRFLFLLLQLPLIAVERKKELMKQVLRHCGLPVVFEKLTSLLLEHHRAALFPEILQQVVIMYRQRNDIELFLFKSSTELSADQCAALDRFLVTLVDKQIIYTVQKDPSLIAGVRLQSDYHLWEHSVASQLRAIKHTIDI